MALRPRMFGIIARSFDDVRKTSENYVCKMGGIVVLISSVQLLSQSRRALFQNIPSSGDSHS